MPQLLLELFSEEIPARMQGAAARDLERMARERLQAAGLVTTELRTFAGPRRLTLLAEELAAATPDRREEVKGPRASAPPQALDGFLRKTGLAREQLTERDGVFYAVRDIPGRPTTQIVAEMVPEIVRAFPWPKSMTSGTSRLRWVRPLRRILCLFDGAVVHLEIDGLQSGDLTEGHRFMGPEPGRPFAVSDFASYRAGLLERCVVLDAADRRARILEGARAACAAEELELVEDEGLLEEVAGLAEWPVPLLGRMDPAFLDLPPEVIRTSMRTHQKYFAVRDPATERLAPRFVVVANIAARDGGATVAAGNAKVLSARLSDARFFWDEDRKTPLEDRLEALKGVTFHAKLGTLYERVQRIEALAREIAPLVGADPELAGLAARLAKADLATGMVGEFPELQGIMGGYYARAEGLPDAVADAVRDHYKPLGPSDTVPTAPVTVAVALADKLDTLVGFFGINERPTGSRDPYALRRLSLGYCRIALKSGFRLKLRQLLQLSRRVWNTISPKAAANFFDTFDADPAPEGRLDPVLVAFFADRLKVLLRDEGMRHDLVDAVFALGDDDLVRIVRRVEALDGFLNTEDGAALLAGYKRATSILPAEAKKHPREVIAPHDPRGPGLVESSEEQALAEAMDQIAGELEIAIPEEDWVGAMRALAQLRTPVDVFFNKVLVNDPDPPVRLRRLRLLSSIQALADRVADFSLVSG